MNKVIIKFKNNRKNEYEVLFEVKSQKYNYLCFTNKEYDKNNNLIIYAIKYQHSQKIELITNKNEQNMLKSIINNLSKEE